MLEKNAFAVKGHIIFTKTDKQFTTIQDGYIVCEGGVISDVFRELPPCFEKIEVIDFGDKIIIPGMADLHVHAPQFTYRGLGMDLELLPWLDTYAFKEEAKFQDEEYAYFAYERFCRAIKHSVTTHASIFATLHVGSTNALMDLLDKAGLYAYVGKVNMDRNSPNFLIESTNKSLADTDDWVKKTSEKYEKVKPIITPRFIPTCTDELMAGLGHIAAKYNTSVQSHLSEARPEIAFVKDMYPCFQYEGKIYDDFQLFGRPTHSIMAHAVYETEEELDLIEKNGVYIAHCPQSNMNIRSGIAPVRKMLDRGIHIGLGSDVAGGFSLSMLRAVSDAVQVSKLYTVVIDENAKQLSLPEAFYMATKGGGSFWGRTGSFEPGYEMNAVVLDDSAYNQGYELSIEQRMERIVCLSSDQDVFGKFVSGQRIF